MNIFEIIAILTNMIQIQPKVKQQFGEMKRILHYSIIPIGNVKKTTLGLVRMEKVLFFRPILLHDANSIFSRRLICAFVIFMASLSKYPSGRMLNYQQGISTPYIIAKNCYILHGYTILPRHIRKRQLITLAMLRKFRPPVVHQFGAN